MRLVERALNRGERLLYSELGPSATEYALMLALIVLAATVAITTVGEGVESTMAAVEQALPEG